MLDNTLTITYDTTPVTLTRVAEQNFSSTYYGENGNDKLTMSVNHTIPARGGTGESHLVRLNVEHYDAEGVYLRTSSAWTVIKTFDGVQNSTSCEHTVAALQDFTAVAANISKVIARES
uniref:Uncharacterized protein n=1 Tax=Beihai levi-like virus 8 TaxID=1922426 RepID=A0A1L3KIA7_9VIRU|nr:hypothetical protein [Beihai levi-like virus 8]